MIFLHTTLFCIWEDKVTKDNVNGIWRSLNKSKLWRMQLCMADTQITFNNECLLPILDPHGHHLLSIVTKSRHMEKSPTWLLFSWMIKNYSICVSRSNSFTIWCIDIYLEESFVGQHSLNVCMGPMPWGLGRIEKNFLQFPFLIHVFLCIFQF